MKQPSRWRHNQAVRIAANALLVFLLFQNVLFTALPLPRFFHYWDEALALLVFAFAAWQLMRKGWGALQSWYTVSALALALTVVLGLLGNLVFGYAQSVNAIFRDVVNFLKFPLTLLLMLKLNLGRALRRCLGSATGLLLKGLTVAVFACGIVSLFTDIGMSQQELRWGVHPYQFLFSHPTYLVLCGVGLLALLEALTPQKGRLPFVFMCLAIIVLALRTKGLAVAAMYVFVKWGAPRLGRHKVLLWCAVAAIGAAVCIGKVLEYLSWTASPRETLYAGSLQLLAKCFPLGSGFASFASHLSWRFQSQVYQFIQIPFYEVNGEISTAVMGDTGYPYYIAQFGLFGLLFCLLGFWGLVHITRKRSAGNPGVTLLWLYILVALTSESTLMNSGTELAVLLAVASSGKKPLPQTAAERYLSEKGIFHVCKVLYRYKLDLLIQKMLLPFVRNKPLRNTIIIESHDDFDSNGGALYDYLIANGYNQKWRIVWLLKHKKPKNLPENVLTFPLRRPGIRKNYHICTAAYLSADNELTEKVRPEQVSLFCDHGGVSLKSVRGLYHLPDSLDYILSPSEAYASVLARQYDISYPNSRFLNVGYPQHDVFWQETPRELEKITGKKYRKVFLWMPTFRTNSQGRSDSAEELPFGVPLLENTQMLDALQRFLAESDSLLLLKIHPKQDLSTVRALSGSENIRILTGGDMKTLGLNNYRLLKDVDALISDYSSIAYSFMLLDRPVGFVLADMESYTRGFAVENVEEYLTGCLIHTFAEFLAFLTAVQRGEDGYADERRALVNRLFTHQDGKTCQRITEILNLHP